MPKSEHKIVISGSQVPVLDVRGLALVILRLARRRQAERLEVEATEASAAPDTGAAA